MSSCAARAPEDSPQILDLAAAALGWREGEPNEALFNWKHRDNVFGPSPMWVAEVDGELAGFRTFLRWEWDRGPGVSVARSGPGRRHRDPSRFPGSRHLHEAHPGRDRRVDRRGRRLRLQHAERSESTRLPEDGVAGRGSAPGADPTRRASERARPDGELAGAGRQVVARVRRRRTRRREAFADKAAIDSLLASQPAVTACAPAGAHRVLPLALRPRAPGLSGVARRHRPGRRLLGVPPTAPRRRRRSGRGRHLGARRQQPRSSSSWCWSWHECREPTT